MAEWCNDWLNKQVSKYCWRLQPTNARKKPHLKNCWFNLYGRVEWEQCKKCVLALAESWQAIKFGIWIRCVRCFGSTLDWNGTSKWKNKRPSIHSASHPCKGLSLTHILPLVRFHIFAPCTHIAASIYINFSQWIVYTYVSSFRWSFACLHVRGKE